MINLAACVTAVQHMSQLLSVHIVPGLPRPRHLSQLSVQIARMSKLNATQQYVAMSEDLKAIVKTPSCGPSYLPTFLSPYTETHSIASQQIASFMLSTSMGMCCVFALNTSQVET